MTHKFDEEVLRNIAERERIEEDIARDVPNNPNVSLNREERIEALYSAKQNMLVSYSVPEAIKAFEGTSHSGELDILSQVLNSNPSKPVLREMCDFFEAHQLNIDNKCFTPQMSSDLKKIEISHKKGSR
ncbi:hypothetical protein KO465_00230 [Candidatus Micrarchaeota archaeon]|nr:hypothetical protein [Candidatus Micrarchaeota archaeon]